LKKINPEIIVRSFECCGLKDGDWQSFEHLNNKLKEFIKPKDDWVEEDKLLERFNKGMQNNFETNLPNVESIIESCSQESYVFELPPKPPKRAYNKKAPSQKNK